MASQFEGSWLGLYARQENSNSISHFNLHFVTHCLVILVYLSHLNMLLWLTSSIPFHLLYNILCIISLTYDSYTFLLINIVTFLFFPSSLILLFNNVWALSSKIKTTIVNIFLSQYTIDTCFWSLSVTQVKSTNVFYFYWKNYEITTSVTSVL